MPVIQSSRDDEEEEVKPVRTMEQLIQGIMKLDDQEKSSDENSEFCSSDDEFDPGEKHRPV